MAMTESKKRQLKVSGLLGLILGVAIFFVFWVMTKSLLSLAIIPMAVLIGMGQGYMAPAYDEEDED